MRQELDKRRAELNNHQHHQARNTLQDKDVILGQPIKKLKVGFEGKSQSEFKRDMADAIDLNDELAELFAKKEENPQHFTDGIKEVKASVVIQKPTPSGFTIQRAEKKPPVVSGSTQKSTHAPQNASISRPHHQTLS